MQGEKVLGGNSAGFDDFPRYCQYVLSIVGEFILYREVPQ